MKCPAVCGCLLGLVLVGCSALPSAGPTRSEVVARRLHGHDVLFDVVKIDDRVIKTLAARRVPRFAARFKQSGKPPPVKIAVGDTVSVVILESASGGLFGDSLSDLGVLGARAQPNLTAGEKALSGLLAGLPTPQTGSPEAGGEMLEALLGSAAFAGLGPAAEPGPEAAGVGEGGVPQSGSLRSQSVATASTQGGSAQGGSTQFESAQSGSAQSGSTPAPSEQNESGQTESGEAGSAAERRLSLLQAAAKGRSEQPGTVVPKQLVGSDGAITIPYAGRVPVAGETPVEVASEIERRLAGKALDPQVLVLDLSSPANSVSVSGAVVEGRRVALEPGGQRLLQVIAAAGGAKAPVRDVFVSLSRNGVAATIPMAALVADPAEDIYARPGDDLTIVRIPKTFSVFGATGKNMAITFDADRLSLAQAVAKAGGLLDQRADPHGVFLLRYEPDRIVEALGQKLATGEHDGFSPVVYRLDMHDPRAYLLAREFPMQDKDIIYVSNAKVISLYKFFNLLSSFTGPIESGFLDCYYANC